MSYRRALTNLSFVRMLAAHGVGSLGQLQLTMAVAVYALERTTSGVWLAVALSLGFAPYIAFSTTAGLLADKYRRSTVLRWSLITRIGTGMLVAVGLWLQWPVAVVVALAALTATLATPSYPALAAATPQLVQDKDLSAANGLATGIENATWVAGPGLLGLVLLTGAPIAGGGLASVMCFALAALCLGRTTTPKATAVADTDKHGFFGGVREVRANPRIRVLLGLAIVDNALYGYLTVAIVLVGGGLLEAANEGIGWLQTAFAVGAFLSMALAANLRADHGVRRVLLFVAGLVASGVALVLARSLPIAVVAVLFAGMFTVIAEVAAVTGIQRAVADETAARVFGLYDTLAVGAIGLGTIVAGWLSEVVGVRVGLFIACLSCVAVCALITVRGRALALDGAAADGAEI
jgi:MFS family permease